jgi:hypothetical protein
MAFLQLPVARLWPSSFSIAGAVGRSDRTSSRSRKSRAPSSGIATAFYDCSIPRLPTVLIEVINSLVHAVKAKARGYRPLRNPIAITYLIAGHIDLKLATCNSGFPFFEREILSEIGTVVAQDRDGIG